MNWALVDGVCLHARFNAGAANLVSTVVESPSVNLVIGSTALQEAGRWLLQLGVLGEVQLTQLAFSCHIALRLFRLKKQQVGDYQLRALRRTGPENNFYGP
ncbi:hypothetical protein CMUST_01380 [Corynebacterium mustelae]|uniref:Uncharacterized protein n=1 Tax=Corynebacterium mustelae TaxID=571915 RepID=A0A0G3GVU6_9CORY|nr:hypothetical protein [Corynebacterium mustelae]AKK04625.1 hypothetical protein CMUST_01380 [Corynebacterium mustelae]